MHNPHNDSPLAFAKSSTILPEQTGLDAYCRMCLLADWPHMPRRFVSVFMQLPSSKGLSSAPAICRPTHHSFRWAEQYQVLLKRLEALAYTKCQQGTNNQ